MKITSFIRHIRDVFENALPDTDIDREYFDLLEHSDGNSFHNGANTMYSDDECATGADGQEDEPRETKSSGTNAGYIHTTRGVRMSFADINHISNQTHRSREYTPSQVGYANTLDLTAKNPMHEDTSPHVLDTRS